VAKEWSNDRIEQQLKVTTIAAVKAVIGTYTIFDLAANQVTIGEEILANIKRSLATVGMPIDVQQVSVTNFDWSKEFDAQIQATMNAAQKVKQAEQEANIAEQTNRKLTIEAEAKAKANVAQAQGELDSAKLRAEAAKVEAEGIAEANRIKAQPASLEYQRAEWNYNVLLERAKHLAPGVEVPMYIPLAPNGQAAVITK
jgi:regulator of protease activity HflC (stomatin/prohibitin superfamily)